MSDKPRHGEIRLSQVARGDGYLITATLFLDPQRQIVAPCDEKTSHRLGDQALDPRKSAI